MIRYCESIIRDDVQDVKYLLDRGLVSPYFFNCEDYFVTPLATAVFYGSPKCVKLLCEHKAATCPPTRKDKATLPPLLALCFSNKPSHVKLEIVQILLNADAVLDWKVLLMNPKR